MTFLVGFVDARYTILSTKAAYWLLQTEADKVYWKSSIKPRANLLWRHFKDGSKNKNRKGARDLIDKCNESMSSWITIWNGFHGNFEVQVQNKEASKRLFQ